MGKKGKKRKQVDENNESDSNEDEGGGDEMECDFSAYTLFHEGSTGLPCLSFDILEDNLGAKRSCDEPVTCYFVAGSQAEKAHLNNIVLMKMENLQRIKTDKEVEEMDEDDDDENDPVVRSAIVKHRGCVNRIRASKVNGRYLAAAWSELGEVTVWDLEPLLSSFDNSDDSTTTLDQKPLFTYRGHGTEGFALDWSPANPGTLATGDCSKKVHVWTHTPDGGWEVGSAPLVGHTASVEDLQWSPNEASVFASCSVDKSIRIWDARSSPASACQLTCSGAHESDVNVIHWNRNAPFLASGGDDAQVLVWDLRKFQSGSPVARLLHHTKPVCTVEWHPSESSVLCSGAEDDCVLQWDLAVEADSQAASDQQSKDNEGVPDQLLFVHQGQKELKEIHWHPQVTGLVLSTAHSGFNVFKTISC